jgi:nicotinamide phosphoribosyltransferase
MTNIIMATDGYKPSQFLQYPTGLTHMFSYIEGRVGGNSDSYIHLGPQGIINKYFRDPITKEQIDEGEFYIKGMGLPFNRAGWEYILKKHGGFIPMHIESAPEGLRIPAGNSVVNMVNTDEKCRWITSYIETLFVRGVWYQSMVATVSKEIKDIIEGYLKRTGTPELIDFKLHDFGARGVSSSESAELGGAAHLVNFLGTDTVEALPYINKNYNNADIAGFTIPAAEHSSVTPWGTEKEKAAFANMIAKFGKTYPIFAAPIDSYNTWDAIRLIKELEPILIESGSTFVLRPDSGHPVYNPIKVVQTCMQEFGCDKNKKGYFVLPDHVRVLQGDGIDKDDLGDILSELAGLNISADNIAFGMGGGLLQKVERDAFAMKCSAAKIDNEWTNVSKNPVDAPEKRSKTGMPTLFASEGESGRQYKTVNTLVNGEIQTRILDSYGWTKCMKPIYKNGRVFDSTTWLQVRDNSNIKLDH